MKVSFMGSKADARRKLLRFRVRLTKATPKAPGWDRELARAGWTRADCLNVWARCARNPERRPTRTK
jgi:hypothetical protein